MDTSFQLTRRDMLSQFIGSASESHIAAVLPHVKSRASGRDEYPLLIIIAPLNKPETWQKSWSVGQARTYYKTTIQEYFTHTYSTKRRQKETIFQKFYGPTDGKKNGPTVRHSKVWGRFSAT